MPKEDLRRGWKLVKVVGDKYCSYTGLSYESSRFYSIGHRTERPDGCGPLAVFTSKEFAERFLELDKPFNRMHEILPCVYKVSQDDWLWDNCGQMMGRMPQGTAFADWVEIHEEVE